MLGLEHYVGQVLDEKYRLEHLLGQGGMGAVYLATHLGTERYVALKLIAPQFMRNQEFVERFKREARAAGRLRHPNVVDVTDFGFARASGAPVAYLVMEYLDGCTLGDVLAEEKRLPLEWVVDIIEQVCSAVHEAHQQGIVHRDLKPDNIWLEPNRLGSYRVKVLDFGIAKLAEVESSDEDASAAATSAQAAGSQVERNSATHPARSVSHAEGGNLESETLVLTGKEPELALADASQSLESDDTQLFAPPPASAPHRPSEPVLSPEDGDGTLMLDRGTRPAAKAASTQASSKSPGTELTRVGAIMGTPVYMSPEQCAAKHLDARSDIYSLGVITYQMLAGDPPFAGDTTMVLRDHIHTSPPPIRERNKNLSKHVERLVMSALAKDPAGRPQSAAAFATSFRAQAEGIGALYRRAFALYSEHFPKFLKLSLIAHIPVIVFTLIMVGLELGEKGLTSRLGKVATVVLIAVFALLQVVSYFLAASAISGMTAVIVTQLSVAPLKPVDLRTAFLLLKRRWKPFLKTSISVTLRILIGFLLFVIPGFIMSIRYALYAPVVLMEGLEKKAARLRARQLAARSWRTVIIISILQFAIPMTVSALLGRLSVRTSTGKTGGGVHLSSGPIYQQLTGLVNIIIIPLFSIVPALLYLKMRQLGGETLNTALAQIEEVAAGRSKWQQRMRTRATLHTASSTTPPSRS